MAIARLRTTTHGRNRGGRFARHPRAFAGIATLLLTVLALDAQAICGDDISDAGEECDDGNLVSLDGCTATCELEDAFVVEGLASAVGVASFVTGGVNVNALVLPGDTPEVVAALLEIAVATDPTLMASGTTATAVGDRLIVSDLLDDEFVDALGLEWRPTPGSVLSESTIELNCGASCSGRGAAIASLGDQDGNGVADIVLGLGETFEGNSLSSFGSDRIHVLLRDDDGSALFERRIETNETVGGTAFGAAVARVGDLDGNGIAEVAVGDWAAGGAARGRVTIQFLSNFSQPFGSQVITEGSGGFAGTLDPADYFGGALAGLDDLDGDGIQDLAVAAPRDDDGGNSQGAVYILFLNADGSVKAQQKISETEGGFTGSLAIGDSFGRGIGALGDVDGDDVMDIAIGAGGGDGGQARGAVWILFLNTDGTVKSHQKISDTQGGFPGHLENGDEFGASVAGLGDLDGDAIPDLLVGADSPLLNGQTTGRTGAVWILFLNADGTVKGAQKIDDVEGGFVGPLTPNREFGSAVASVGDTNGDGVAEILVGQIVSREAWSLSIASDGGPMCGDDVVAPSEACDDGNMTSGDGCFSTCDFEDEVGVVGVAQGGAAQVVVDGVVTVVATTAGETGAQVAERLAIGLNVTPAHQQAGVSAVSIDARFITNGTIDAIFATDPGLLVPEPGFAGGLLLAAGAGLIAGGRRRR